LAVAGRGKIILRIVFSACEGGGGTFCFSTASGASGSGDSGDWLLGSGLEVDSITDIDDYNLIFSSRKCAIKKKS
jgi:hypothetical protein